MEDGENGAKSLWNGYTRKKSMKDIKKSLNWVEKKWRGGEYTVLQDFLRQIDW